MKIPASKHPSSSSLPLRGKEHAIAGICGAAPAESDGPKLILSAVLNGNNR